MSKVRFYCCLAAALCFSSAVNAGSRLGPDAPIHLAQGKGKGDPPGGPPITPPGQGGTPPGQQKSDTPTPTLTPTPTDHGSGVHGAHGRDSGAFGTPSGQRGTREVPEGR